MANPSTKRNLVHLYPKTAQTGPPRTVSQLILSQSMPNYNSGFGTHPADIP
jgi:hypothetical protein